MPETSTETNLISNSKSSNTFTYIVLIILILAVIGLAIWIFTLSASLKTCENSESQFCPSYYCPTVSDRCNHLPYRKSDPNTCQLYAASSSKPINLNQ